jgi:hypothetical protein
MEKILTRNQETGEVEFSREECEKIPEFRTLLTYKYNKQPGDADGKKRVRANSEITYIWFMYSRFSPFVEYSEEERHTEALLCAELPTKWQPSDELKAAIDKYVQTNWTRILRLVMAAEKAIDKLRGFFENVDFTKKDDKGALVYKPSEVIRAIVDLDKVANGLDKLANRQKHEVKEGSATRGGQEDGWIMDKTEYEDTRRPADREPDEDDSSI